MRVRLLLSAAHAGSHFRSGGGRRATTNLLWRRQPINYDLACSLFGILQLDVGCLLESLVRSVQHLL